MSPLRRTAVVVTWAMAAGLLLLLLSLTWGLASEYGAPTSDMAFLVAVPGVVALLAVGLGSGGRGSVLALGVFVLVAVVGLSLSGALGQRERLERFAAQDAGFTCNGPHAEASVPDDVDAAFHVPAHPAGHGLYGPVSRSPAGCTAAIHGDATRSFPAWREAILATGWRVRRDDTELVTTRGGVRLTLYVEGEVAMLNAAAVGADDCADGRLTSDGAGQVSAC